MVLLTNWISFWDSYRVAIHTNPDLSNADKFTYLQSLVERSAKDAISGLSLTTPLICEPMMSTPAEVCIANYESLRSLDLAGSSTSSTLMKPDLLIGLDYYQTFVSGELIQCSDGLGAQNTQFGWVLSGPIPDSHLLPHSANLVTHVLRVDAAPIENDQ